MIDRTLLALAVLVAIVACASPLSDHRTDDTTHWYTCLTDHNRDRVWMKRCN